jgi:hypothetical protein
MIGTLLVKDDFGLLTASCDKTALKRLRTETIKDYVAGQPPRTD